MMEELYSRFLAVTNDPQAAATLAAAAAKFERVTKPKPAVRPVAANLEAFIAERCFEVPGAVTKFKSFCEAFEAWSRERGLEDWPTKMEVIRALPRQFPYGVKDSNIRSIGNLSLTPAAPGREIVLRNGKLRAA